MPGTPPAMVMPLQIQRAKTNAVLTWWVTVPFTLQAAPGVTGTYTNIDGATTPFTNSIDSPAKFYRLNPIAWLWVSVKNIQGRPSGRPFY